MRLLPNGWGVAVRAARRMNNLAAIRTSSVLARYNPGKVLQQKYRLTINYLMGTPPALVKGSRAPSVRSRGHLSLFYPWHWHCFLVIHALCTGDIPTPVHGQESSTC